MIQHVYERARRARLVQDVFVATDNKLIYDTVEGFGGNAIMTSETHPSGTDRIAEAIEKLQAIGHRFQATDIIVNVQGDEPLIHPQMIDDVIRLMDDERASIGTLSKRIEDTTEVIDPNIVKVVFNSEGFALYFSRSPIPYHRNEWKDPGQITVYGSQFTLFKHIGIYAYRKDVLLILSKLPPTKLEEIERLEQLRALENGFRIKVKETKFETIGVDTSMDLERVEKCLNTSL
ncbi:3-deoxy-manno-octulosonate cytidylyltransferase [Dissulfurispira thermophila]|uniref:3-deoxy-manno-octulosonate cytidylyltransferase n=2 Tax=root TaxID=1 RepID=A0A7G1H424_9BACT|nr:3-deoxy-manno-octulosonate cytidylyltransferase [Dissulfurispira thermophila]